jgi:hypothetical protein
VGFDDATWRAGWPPAAFSAWLAPAAHQRCQTGSDRDDGFRTSFLSQSIVVSATKVNARPPGGKPDSRSGDQGPCSFGGPAQDKSTGRGVAAKRLAFFPAWSRRHCLFAALLPQTSD